MKKTALLALVSVAMTVPALAQTKIDNRLGESAEVLNQILLKPDEIPQAYLNKSRCVLVFPAVKKVGELAGCVAVMSGCQVAVLAIYGITLNDVKLLIRPKDERMRELISLRAFGLSEIDAVRYYVAMKMAEHGLVSAPNMAVGAPFNIGYTGQPPATPNGSIEGVVPGVPRLG